MNERRLRDTRRTMLQAVMLVALIGTGGCGKRAATGQTVAIVNGDPITINDLNLELAALPPGARGGARAKVLEALVSRKLLAQDAKKRGVDRTPDFVLQERRARELMLAQRALRETVEDAPQPTSDSEIQAYLDGHPDIGAGRRILLVEQLQFTTPTPAAKLAALKPARSLDELAAILKSQGVAVKRARAQLDTATLGADVLARIATLQPGEPLIAVNGANSVASSIVETRAVPIGPADAKALAKKRIEADRLAGRFNQYERSLRNAAQISYAKS